MSDPGNYNYTRPRGPIAAMYHSPGPIYGLPGLVGQRKHDPRSVHNKGPAYPFGLKHGKFRDDCSPGPQYHPSAKIYRDGQDGTPHYSLYGRPKDTSTFRPPGPGAYSPEKSSRSAYPQDPAYSFGSRHRHRRTDDTPAPNRYSVDPMMGRTIRSSKKQAPVYSMTGRSKVGSFCEDLAKTPGPGNYGTTNPNISKNKPPAYSMTSRNPMPGDGTTKPGPGAHSPERVYANKRAAPKITFGMKHSPYVAPLIIDPAY